MSFLPTTAQEIRRSLTTALLLTALATPGWAAQPSCGDTIGPDADVVLEADLECDDGNAAITIVGPATLDLNGFAIRCTDRNGNGRTASFGIRVDGVRATVRNGAVNGCRGGVAVAGQGRHTVADVTALFGGAEGFRIQSDRNRISECSALLNGGDGYQVTGKSNALSGNLATNNGDVGFRVEKRSTLKKNVASGNAEDGFAIHGTGSALTENRALGSLVGFMIFGSNNRLVENDARANLVGFFVDGFGKSNLLRRNEANDNDVGLAADGVGNRFVQNRANDNALRGISLSVAAEKNTVSGSVARNNDVVDLGDESADCGSNRWVDNTFGSSNRPCIR